MAQSEYALRRLAEIEAEQAANPKPPPDPNRTAGGRFAPGNEIGVETQVRGNSNGQGWKKGQSGNPLGKKPGSKNLLSHQFIRDLSNVWRRRGREVLEELVTNNPAALAALAARYVPPESLVVDQKPQVLEFQWAGNGEAVPAPPQPAERQPLLVDMRAEEEVRAEPLEQAKPVQKIGLQRPADYEEGRRRLPPISYPPNGVV